MFRERIVVDRAGGRHAPRVTAAPRLPRRRCRAIAGRLRAPGIAHVTASNIRIQRSANCAIVTPAGTSGAQASTACKPAVVGHARERLALIEHLAVPVEVAMVVGSEHRVAAQLAGEQTAGERHPREDPDALRLGFREERARPA